MKRLVKPAIYIAIGLLLAFPVFSMTYYTMVRTSTPQFLFVLPRDPFCLPHLADLHPRQQCPGLRGGLHGLPSARAAGHH